MMMCHHRKNTLATEIRARVAADEWAKMFAYNIAEGQAKDRRQVRETGLFGF